MSRPVSESNAMTTETQLQEAIEALKEIQEECDREIDINEHGGPNLAMRIDRIAGDVLAKVNQPALVDFSEANELVRIEWEASGRALPVKARFPGNPTRWYRAHTPTWNPRH